MVRRHGKRKLMDEMKAFCNGLNELLNGLGVPLVIGFVSSFVRITRFGWRSWRQFAVSAIVSCFVGVMVYWGLDYVNLPPTVDAAIIAISSYMGGNLLDAIQARAIKDIRTGKRPGPQPEEGR